MPPAVPIIMAGTAMIGAGVAAYGQRQAGKQEQKMQEINAKQQEQDALDRQAETIAQSREMRGDQERAMSSQRAQYAKSNVLMEGTPLQVMVETSADFQMKRLNLERQGAHESNLLRRGAAISRYAGVNARKAGNIASTGTILSGIAASGSAYMGARSNA